MDNQPTTRQLVLFGVLLSFIVSIIGTVLTLGFFGSFSGAETGSSPSVFLRPRILEKLSDAVIPQPAPEPRAVRQEDLVIKAVESASPAVVSVVATKDVPVVEQFFVDPFGDDPFFKQFFGDNGSGLQVPQFRQKGTEKKEVSSGTGFLVSPEGFILTNKHVVTDKDAQYTALMNDGRKLTAKVLARDPFADLAILKIQGANFPYLALGDSSKIKIGQTVIAIGNALGEFRNTVSVGIISGLRRSIVATGNPTGPEVLDELIQTDAAINPGNSGGPLLDLNGQVIGINTAVARGAENIGFTLPINKAKRDIEAVKKSGRIMYPFLGVRFVTVTKELAGKDKLGRDYGALLRGTGNESAVASGSPAQKAGLAAGDIILKLNDERISINQTLSSLLVKYQVGDAIILRVFRENREFDVKVVLEERT
ncbi:MAG: trypsin-like peptidase domain-containing protein [Candidatus Sungbacteria bacterium]|nr:trypsin-like peptidase domain-containing protein [Candidatus Sungbacteria bacterium]